MPAPSISLSHLAWSTPDGRAVFTDLCLDFAKERTGLIGRNGTGKSTLLRLMLGEVPPTTGSIRVAGTVGALRQIVQVSPRQTVADLLGIADALAILRKAETGIATVEEIADADWTVEARAEAALAQVGLGVVLDTPLIRLSGGQRTRAALAGAVLNAPDFLLLDEPTNNLDREGRVAVMELLAQWRAGAIVVSHDRELLETMDAIVELSSLGARRYGGNWSHYRERKAIERAAAQQDLAASERKRDELSRCAQQAAERQQRRDAGGARKAASGDLPRIVLGMRRDQAEKTGGSGARLAQRQREEADLALATARSRVEHFDPLTVALASTGLASNRTVVSLQGVTAGYDDGDAAVLKDFSLTVIGPERIAISGGNGVGKSTLFRVITGDLAPRSGRVSRTDSIAFLDQRVDLLDPRMSLAENFVRYNPGTDDNGARASLARFQFRGDAADRPAGTLSGGQLLRAGLACVLGGVTPPSLLILDEPANHLDVESIEAVEAGLRNFDGALLVTSHDTSFLENIAITRWVTLSAKS